MTCGRFLAALTLLGALGLAPAARADIPELAGAWHLDSNGATSPDTSGHNLTANRVGTPVAVSPARFGNGLRFPTEGDYLDAGSHSGLQPAHVSVLAWVRSAATPATVKGIVSQGASGSCSFSSYSIYTGGSAPADVGTRFYVHTAGGTVRTTAVNNASVWNGQWHLLSGTYDGTTSKIYIDGSLAGSGTGPAGPIAYGLGLNNDFIIGGALDPSCVESTNFTGDMDEVRVYNRALSQDEIAYLARADHTSPPELPIPPPPPPPPPAGRNTAAPTISTGGVDGGLRVYNCSSGTWADINTGAGFRYTWWRSNRTASTTGTPPPDTKMQTGTNASYKLPKADSGKTHYCEVTATGLNGQPVSKSSPAKILTGLTDAATPPAATAQPAPYGNLKIDGIDIFQVTQPNLRSPRFPTAEDPTFATCGLGTPTDYKIFNGTCVPFDDDPQKVDYRGVTLDARKKTYALVYLSTESQTPYPSRLVDVSLDVTAGGGSVGGTWGLRTDPRIQALHYVTRAQRLDPTKDSAMVFELDPSWLAEAVRRGGKFNVSAFAQIAPGLEGVLQQCQGANDCRADDRFEVQDIPVEDDLPDLTIKTVPMLTPLQRTSGAEIGAGYVLNSPEEVLARTRQLYPAGERMNILPYKTILYIPFADILIAVSPYCQGFDSVRSCRDAYVDAVLDEYLARTIDFGYYDILVAVHHFHADNTSGRIDGGWTRQAPLIAGTAQPLMIVQDAKLDSGATDRPILAVAHEFGHAMGAPHADTLAPDPVSGRKCGGGSNGQDAEDWPPDNTGRLQSAAYDNGKLRMDAPDTPLYDLMSYCAGFDDSNGWISAWNWTRAFDTLRDYARVGLRRRALRARSASRGQGFVSGVIGNKGASIVRVVPPSPENNPPAPDPKSPIQVRALDAAGKTLGVVGAKVTRSSEEPEAAFVVGMPKGAATVELLSNGQVVDRKTRSKAPRVSVSSPRGGTRVGAGARSRMTVRWKATDPDKDPLSATIEFSANGSSGWTPVWVGANSGRAVVPGRFLQRGTHARIRVKISDGFNETTAVSRAFRAEGAPPMARIILPAGSKLPAPGRTLLAGSGIDDRNRVLKGRSLTWFAGKRRLGRGEQLRARLPGGNVTLRLQVRDRFGRVTTAVRRLKITPKQLQIATLSGPAHVAKGARSVKVTVRTTIPATLSVGGRHFAVGAKAKRLTIPLPRKPGTGVLKLKLSFTAKGPKQRVLRQLITVLRS